MKILQETRFWQLIQKVLRDPKNQFRQESKKRAGTNLNREILDALAERLWNFHDSARALASCLQTCGVTRKTDQSMIVAAKRLFIKLQGEASDDLERVTPQSHENPFIETQRSKHRCSETPSHKTFFSFRDIV